jgi:hypothetical protein
MGRALASALDAAAIAATRTHIWAEWSWMASKVREPSYQPRPGLEGICRDHRCYSLRLPDVARNNAHHRVLAAEMPRQDLIPSLDLWAACDRVMR